MIKEAMTVEMRTSVYLPDVFGAAEAESRRLGTCHR